MYRTPWAAGVGRLEGVSLSGIDYVRDPQGFLQNQQLEACCKENIKGQEVLLSEASVTKR